MDPGVLRFCHELPEFHEKEGENLSSFVSFVQFVTEDASIGDGFRFRQTPVKICSGC